MNNADFVKYKLRADDGKVIFAEYDPKQYSIELSLDGDKLTLRKIGTLKKLKIKDPLFIIQTDDNTFLVDRQNEENKDIGMFHKVTYASSLYSKSHKQTFHCDANYLYHKIIPFDITRIAKDAYYFHGSDYNRNFLVGDAVYNSTLDTYLYSPHGMKIDIISNTSMSPILNVQESVTYEKEKDILLYKLDPEKFTYLNDICSITQQTCVDAEGVQRTTNMKDLYEPIYCYLKNQSNLNTRQYKNKELTLENK